MGKKLRRKRCEWTKAVLSGRDDWSICQTLHLLEEKT